jgi:hypothetical protein
MKHTADSIVRPRPCTATVTIEGDTTVATAT